MAFAAANAAPKGATSAVMRSARSIPAFFSARPRRIMVSYPTAMFSSTSRPPVRRSSPMARATGTTTAPG